MTAANTNILAHGAAVLTISMGDIKPSPENDRLYRPINPVDPDIIALADSIQKHGLQEPLTLSSDRYILSGHRRFAAAKLAGLAEIRCIIRPDVHHDDTDQFVRLLREYNRQRVKSFDEMLREEAVAVDSNSAYQHLLIHRRRNSDLSQSASSAIELDEKKRRAAISPAKMPMLAAIMKVIEDRWEYWPLSDRQIHYALLNNPPLRHASKPDSVYANDKTSYKALTDLMTRARLKGFIPWESIADVTRPVSICEVYRDPSTFVRKELEEFGRDYWRDLQQSQLNHIEVVAEKLTVEGILKPVCAEFCIPLTVGRGFCSLQPRYELAQRFRKSGREKLIVLLVSDFDPDGEVIAKSFAQSMRDDFGIYQIHAVKVALTADQIQQYGLPQTMEAKTSSANYKKFVKATGTTKAYELEALPPETLAMVLREAIKGVMDGEAFRHEEDQQRDDAAKLAAFRTTTLKMIGEVRL